MNKKLIGLALLIVSLLTIVGCSSNSDASSDESAETEKEKVFEETDEIAREFYQAGFELNIPKAHSMLSPAGQEKLENEPYVTGIVKEDGSDLHASDLVDPEEYGKYKKSGAEGFKDFDKLNDEYEIRRYDYVYDEDSKEIIYYVKPWRGYEFKDGDSNFISMKQNEEGEWKIKQFIDSIPEDVNGKDSGTIIHPYKKAEDSEEDEYGFE
ncbi:hypothetical protein ACFOGI_15300 [Virgibacillus xinjiangensis]|uniref:Uncharacterized protein n=1 Tax=Virgibacillus xinjiangensis TaxID=393090 RepID=A0ABV7CZ69_9BACI